MLFSICAAVMFFFAVIGVYCTVTSVILDLKRDHFHECVLIRVDDTQGCEYMVRYAMMRYKNMDIYVVPDTDEETNAILDKLCKDNSFIHIINTTEN